MHTMHPVVLHGCTTWDQERLPQDEFGERLRCVQDLMKKSNVKGLIIYGDCREYAKLCYLTNYIPKHSWAVVLVPAEGNPRLVANVAGTRDIPSVRLLTWIEDIRPAKNISEEMNLFMNEIRKERNGRSESTAIGIYGEDRMRASLYEEIAEQSRDMELKSMNSELDGQLLLKRPREIAVMREVNGILKAAVDAMKEIHKRGGSVVTAVIEADRTARYLGAQDVRTLHSLDFGRTLQPFENLSEIRNDPLVAYVAVEYLGYWAETFVTLRQKENSGPVYQTAVKLLDFFTETMKSGVKMGDLVDSALEIIKPFKLHPVSQDVFGHGIGLSLEEKPFLQTSCGEGKIAAGSVCSIQVCLTDDDKENVLLSTTIAVTERGNDILWTSLEK
jgi:Xaa-Pro aminopeptidase